jgi:phage head maturation protease
MEAADRPKMGEVEERTAGGVAVDGRRIRGIVPYRIESRTMPGGWKEVIEPTAFRNTKLDDLRVTIDHKGVPLGRYPATLDLEDRADGLHWALDPPKSRADVVEAIDRGDLRAGSWRMKVAREEWRGNTRHVHEIAELKDVCIAAAEDPCYPAAAIELRTRNTDPAEGQEDNMAEQADKQDSTEEVRTEERKPPAGSLRVEDRTADIDIKWRTMADLYGDRGFFENRVAQIGWDEYRSFTWSAGTVLTDLNPLRTEGVPFGYDRRWLYPVLPTTAVSDATTAVQYLRQSARTLAGTAVLRPLDSVTTKPETSSTVEYKTQQLEQVATISKDVPRIMSNQPMFQSVIEQDLRLSINDGLDEAVRRGIAQAGTIVRGSDDILEVARKAMTLVQAEGYNPNTLAIDPAGAQALDLLRTPGTEKFYIWPPGTTAPGPFGLSIRVWKAAGTAVLDADAYGRLYVAPVELRAFEQDAGQTNKQTVRMETAAAYTAERIPAARRIT